MAGPIQSTASYPKALWEGVKLWWEDAAKAAPDFTPELFKKVTSTKSYEEYVQSVGLGLAKVKAEGAPITFDSPSQGFVTRGVNQAYGLGIIVTYEELKDNLYKELTERRVRRLRRAFAETKNINAVNVYNNAFNSAYQGGDGFSLLNTAHPNASGGTYANMTAVSSSLSQTSLQDMLILMMQSKNDRGYIEPLQARNLIVHPNNFFVADTILGSDKQVGTNNNDINPINVRKLLPEGFISVPYLSATGPWFVRTNAEDGMIYQEREALDTWEDNDADTRNFKVGAYERYTMLWVNPRGLFGSNAA